MRLLHADDIKRLMAQAIANGATRRSLTHCEWSVAGKCASPKRLELYGRPEAPPGVRDVAVGHRTPIPLWLTLDVRCRQCEKCLRYRQALWTERTENECKRASRTWFGSLTLEPERQYENVLRTIERLAAVSVSPAQLTDDEWFIERTNTLYREVQLYLKRLRKETGGKLRFICVAEAHKSGEPHLHMLMHEGESGVADKRTLERPWKLGFAKWKLVKEGSNPASYVCKYLSKSQRARVRASIGYGGSQAAIPSGLIGALVERAVFRAISNDLRDPGGAGGVPPRGGRTVTPPELARPGTQ